MKDDAARLSHLLDAARKAVAFADGKRRDDLEEDEMLSRALVRLLEIVGEAAKSVSEEVRQQHSEVPWRSMAGTRDRLIHGYFDVDLDIVWAIVKDDLPPLIDQLERMAVLRSES